MNLKIQKQKNLLQYFKYFTKKARVYYKKKCVFLKHLGTK